MKHATPKARTKKSDDMTNGGSDKTVTIEVRALISGSINSISKEEELRNSHNMFPYSSYRGSYQEDKENKINNDHINCIIIEIL